jgi:hypothetical protein
MSENWQSRESTILSPGNKINPEVSPWQEVIIRLKNVRKNWKKRKKRKTNKNASRKRNT